MKWFMRILSVFMCVMLIVGVVRVKYYYKNPLTFEGILARISSAGSVMEGNNFKVNTNLVDNFFDVTVGWGFQIDLWDVVKYGFAWLITLIPKILTGVLTIIKMFIDAINTFVNAIIALWRVFMYIFFDL